MNHNFGSTRTWLWGFASFGFVFTGLAVSGIPGWSRLTFLFEAMLVLLAVADIGLGRARFGKWILLFLPFLLLAVIQGIIRYPNSHDALVRLLGTWIGVLLAGEAVRRGMPIRVIINAMLLASIVNALAVAAGFDSYYLYSATAAQQSYNSVLDRRSGLVGNANLLAIQAAIPLFAAVIWRHGLSKILVCLGIASLVYAVFTTGSRKLLLLIFFLIISVWMSVTGRKRNSAIAGFTIFIGFIAAYIITDAAHLVSEDALRNVVAVDRVYQAIEGNDNSLRLRVSMIDSAQDLFMANPFFGGGLGYFADISGYGAYAHNNFWELAVAGGLTLLVAYYMVPVVIGFQLMKYAKRGMQWPLVALIALVTLVVNDMGMVAYDEKSIVLVYVLLAVTTLTPSMLKKVGAR